jgi:ABC-type microcin C transport system permease subunit YejB
MQGASTLIAAANASDQPGAGDVLRIVLVVAIVGGVFLAWFLLRGYGGDGNND